MKSDLESLNSLGKAPEKESKKKGKKRKLQEEEAHEAPVVHKSNGGKSDELETLELILSSLAKCFEYDEIGFLNANR